MQYSFQQIFKKRTAETHNVIRHLCLCYLKVGIVDTFYYTWDECCFSLLREGLCFVLLGLMLSYNSVQGLCVPADAHQSERHSAYLRIERWNQSL